MVIIHSLAGPDPISRLGMGPTALSMVSPRGMGVSAPKEPYVDLLTSDVYYPQPLLKPPWQRGKEKIVTLSHYKMARQSIVLP
jgi:hypothetical protein